MSTQPEQGATLRKFKFDENLPAEAAELLRQAGHDAVTVMDQSMSGAPDRDLAQVCRAEDRVLVTLDLDFSNIQAYPPAAFPGIIVLRLVQNDKASVMTALAALLPYLDREPLSGRLWILDPRRLRIRQ